MHLGHLPVVCNVLLRLLTNRMLAEAQVFPHDHLFIVDSEEFDNDDILSMVPSGLNSGEAKQRKAPEKGFKDSILVGT